MSIFKELRDIQNNTLNNVLSNETNYKEFLNSYAYLYKYSLDNALLIYASDKNAKMVATYEIWQRLGLGVKSDCNTIRIFNENGSRYDRVYSIEDTYELENVQSKDLKQWKIDTTDERLSLLRYLSNNDSTNYLNFFKYLDKNINSNFDEIILKFKDRLNINNEDMQSIKTFVSNSVEYVGLKRLLNIEFEFENKFDSLYLLENETLRKQSLRLINTLSKEVMYVVEKDVKLWRVEYERRTNSDREVWEHETGVAQRTRASSDRLASNGRDTNVGTSEIRQRGLGQNRRVDGSNVQERPNTTREYTGSDGTQEQSDSNGTRNSIGGNVTTSNRDNSIINENEEHTQVGSFFSLEENVGVSDDKEDITLFDFGSKNDKDELEEGDIFKFDDKHWKVKSNNGFLLSADNMDKNDIVANLMWMGNIKEHDYTLLMKKDQIVLTENKVEEIPQEQKVAPSPNVKVVEENVAKGQKVKKPNYKYNESDHIGIGGPKEKYRQNVEAIRTLKEIERGERLVTPKVQSILAKYNGWGGLANAFDENNSSWSNEYEELKKLLSDEEYAKARATTLTSFYTPKEVVQSIYKVLENMNFTTGRVLEPSMGIGNFYAHLPESMSGSELYGVEMDSISGRIAKRLYPNAEILISKYEEVDFKDNYFDVAIGNVPFANIKPRDRVDNKQGFMLHDYFFAKTLNKVRAGGVVAFVTSKGTLDKQSVSVRKYLAERADLLGAIRLPNNAFEKVAGTTVTTDIIFLQKRDTISVDNPNWIYSDGITNDYFKENPHMIIGNMTEVSGPYGNTYECIADEDLDIEFELNRAIENIKGNISVYEHTNEEKEISKELIADESIKTFSFGIINNQVYYRESRFMENMNFTGTKLERAKGMIEIRDLARQIIRMQVEGAIDEDVKAVQKELNKVYDRFVIKYGNISSVTNKSLFRVDNSYPLISSLENARELEDGTKVYDKGEFFTKLTVKKVEPVVSAENSLDALRVSLNEKGSVDLKYICSLLGNKDLNVVLNDLQGEIYLNPLNIDENDRYVGYESKTLYLSGNVREKLRLAKVYAKDDERFIANVQALEMVQPEPLTADQITVRLGTTFITNEDYEQFMFELLDTPNYLRSGNENSSISIKYNNITSEYSILNKRSHNSILVNNTYGTSRASAYKLIETTLNQQFIKIKDKIVEDGKERYVINKEETKLAEMKQEEIKEQFKEWIFKDPERRQRYVEYYNEHYNNLRPTKYDGSYLTFPQMSNEISLREHQKNAIARVINSNGNTLLAHCVGAGKTYEMIASCMEQRRIGLIKKAMMVVPNHLTGEFGAEFMKLYPTSKVLVTTEKDFAKANRQLFVSRIATGDYDAIVIGHSQFEKIPISKQRQILYLRNQVDDLMSSIEMMNAEKGKSWSVKQKENQRQLLEERLKDLLDNPKDDVITFEELGVDCLYVDEAHNFKNLSTFTKMSNVAGMPTSASKKASDLLMKTEYINEINNGRGVVFATGTPISNTLGEMFVMQKYLQMDTLLERNIEHFDNWVSTFAEITNAVELAPEGSGYIVKTRLSNFVNLPELTMQFREFADVVLQEDLDLDVPSLKNGKYVDIIAGQSDFVLRKMEEFIDRAKNIRNGSVKPYEDNMLKIISEAKKVGLDERLLEPSAENNPNSKVNLCIEKVYEEWLSSTDIKGTQIVFCDIGTPNGNGFSIYNYVKEELVKKGIPENEICFIHDAGNQDAKKLMYSQMNSGAKRIILGSTQKMGTGTNIQTRLVALHHLDVTWRPADLEQREGRIIRQGNMNEEVNIYRYATKGTFDTFSWQVLEKKQKFIAQIMTSDSITRIAEDISDKELSYSEMKAISNDNPLISEKMTLDYEITKLNLAKSSYNKVLYSLQDKIINLPIEKARLEKRLKGLQEDIIVRDADTELQFIVCINGKTCLERSDAGELISAEIKKLTYENSKKVIGTYKGFELSVSINRARLANPELILRGSEEYAIEITSSAGVFIKADNVLKGLEERIKNNTNEIEEITKEIEVAKVEVEKPFRYSDELNVKIARRVEVEAMLKINEQVDNFAVDSVNEYFNETELEDEMDMER